MLRRRGVPGYGRDMSYTVAALYQFAPFEDPAALRDPLLTLCQERDVCGTLLLAREGINGTIAGSADAIEAVLGHIRALPGCASIDVKYSAASAQPFRRMKVRLKKEIVTLGAAEADPTKQVGTYVDAAHWNALISDPETLVLDTRNAFEVAMGTFEGAVDPGIRSFGEFKEFTAQKLDPAKHRRIAMFCTGGIRCEKASAYLLARGFGEVFHPKGGILKYLEGVPESESRWHGECVVFDDRVALGHGLRERPK